MSPWLWLFFSNKGLINRLLTTISLNKTLIRPHFLGGSFGVGTLNFHDQVYPMVFWGTTIYLDNPHIVLGLHQLFWMGISFLKKCCPGISWINFNPSFIERYQNSYFWGVKISFLRFFGRKIVMFWRFNFCIFPEKKLPHAHKASNYAFAETSSSSSADEKVGLGSSFQHYLYSARPH